MRTKTLLLTAALLVAGAASSMAQVYSVNAVGYVNLSLPKGFTMINHQFVQPSYKIKDVIPSAVGGTIVYKFNNPGGYDITIFDEFDLVWDKPDMNLNLGGGFFINPPAPMTLTFVGEVPQGTLNTPTPTGFNMVSSQVPQAGTATALGLVGDPGDILYQFSNVGGYKIYIFDEFDLVWTRNGVAEEPSLGVSEAFFLNKGPGSAHTAWTRTFTVN
jgi:hypothetical protein